MDGTLKIVFIVVFCTVLFVKLFSEYGLRTDSDTDYSAAIQEGAESCKDKPDIEKIIAGKIKVENGIAMVRHDHALFGEVIVSRRSWTGFGYDGSYTEIKNRIGVVCFYPEQKQTVTTF